MDEWMMDGWMDEQIEDGWMNMDRWTVRRIDGYMHAQISEEKNGWMGDCIIHGEEALVSQQNPCTDRTGGCRRADRHAISGDTVICSTLSQGEELRIEQGQQSGKGRLEQSV